MKNDEKCQKKNDDIGGQAILDGIMLRQGRKVSMAVRNKNRIILKTETVPEAFPIISKVPIFRGIVNLWENMSLGIKSFSFSAQISEGDGGNTQNISNIELAITFLFAMFSGIGIFVLLPSLIAHFITSGSQGFLFSIIEGSARLVIFLSYVIFISKMKDIRKVFEYHGAEHKVVSAYECKDHKDIPSIRKYSRLHPRCGTSFLFIAIIFSSLLFSFLPTGTIFLRLILRIATIPLVIGITYELMRKAKPGCCFVGDMLAWPGLSLQNLTTLEPTDDQIEVAMIALSGLGQAQNLSDENRCIAFPEFER